MTDELEPELEPNRSSWPYVERRRYEPPADLGPPPWVWRLLGVAIAVALVVVVVVAGVVSVTLLERFGEAKRASERSECIGEIRDERRNVLDNLGALLDLDRTEHDRILGDALLARALTIEGGPTVEELEAQYLANNAELAEDSGLSMRLLPKLPSVDELAEHGGTLPVVDLETKVVSRHRVEACPGV